MVEISMYEPRRIDCRNFGIVIAGTVLVLTLSPFATALDDKNGLPDRSSRPATRDSDSYRQFAGAKGRVEWADNGLKMKFVWCRPGRFEIGPIQHVGNQVVNENQNQRDRVRPFERRSPH